MRFMTKLIFAILAGGLIRADVRTPIPPDPGDPAYSYLGRNQDGSAFLANDGEWVAFWFIRDPSCIPTDFNLLDTDDFTPAFPGGPPRPFLCPNTVKGFAIWKNGPPPVDSVPVQASWQGLGAVPVWFAKLSEVRAAAADDKLTITEIRSLPSLRKGVASVFEEVEHFGLYRPQGEGNGSIEAVASGVLEGGVRFQLEYREMGVKDGGGVSYVRHARIQFQ